MKRLLMIANADAGTAEEDALAAAIEVLGPSEVELCRTGDADELDEALRRADGRTIVLAGGDGSLHAAVAALHGSGELDRQALALLPLGTGNDFARALGLPLDPAAAARVVLEGAPRAMDLIVDDLGRVVVNNVHAGVSSHASRVGATWKGRLAPLGLGLLGYPIGALATAVRPPFVRLRVEVDEEVVADVDRHIAMVAIGNGSSVGGGTRVTPEADPEDGRLDVMVAFATGGLSRLGYAVQLGRGEHHRRDDVRYLRGSTVSLAGEEFWLSADGELSGPERRRSWHLERAAYRLVVP